MDLDLNSLPVVHNEAENRFEVTIDGQMALATYRLRDNRMIINHTEVPPHLRGRGIAAKIARAALDYARSHNLLVLPTCPYTAGFIRKHAEYQDLVPPDVRENFLGS